MTMTMPSNKDFIDTIFGSDAPHCHVTDFKYPPDAIPSGKAHLIAWMGDYFKNYTFNSPSNQYFTISTFGPDENGKARRRKALFQKTHCIVLDDVKEKLVQAEVDKLPQPSWILASSEGSEQWGYILNVPCTDRAQVENLLDGLIANGLAPDGKDSGMKGVTRYVRLPEGINNKTKKLVNGHAYNCQILAWNPFNRVTMAELAAPLAVDLFATRREGRVDGAATVSDHPVMQLTDIIHVKEERSDGRFDITCPWVDEHTGQEDSGSAIFTNTDGSIGFKCHHGNCQVKTGKDLLDFIEVEHTGFRAKLKSWQFFRDIGSVVGEEVVVAEPPIAAPSFLEADVPVVTVSDSLAVPVVTPASTPFAQYRATALDHPQFKVIQEALLKHYDGDSVNPLERVEVHKQIQKDMDISKKEFESMLTSFRKQWYEDSVTDTSFFTDFIYVGELNKLYNFKKRIFYTSEAFMNAFAHITDNPSKEALKDGMVKKVDKLDFAPLLPPIFEEDGVLYANSWVAGTVGLGVEGDASPWLKHFDVMGWGGEYRKHILQWMAWTLRHPDQKINHMIILGGHEGSGKDFLLRPLTHAMRSQYKVISGEELLSSFNEYTMSTKYLHINECEMSDKRDAETIAKKLKPLCTAPPLYLPVNQKGISTIYVRNVASVSMTCNTNIPFRVNGPTRRMYGLWSDLRIKDRRGSTRPEWQDYWEGMWNWMDNGGMEYCIWYLQNCVDLSDFKPGASPPMTEWMQDITEASKEPLAISIDNLIEAKFNSFKNDLVSTADMVHDIKEAAGIMPKLIVCKVDMLVPHKLTMLLRKDSTMLSWKTHHGEIFCVRGDSKYMGKNTEEISNLYNPTDKVHNKVINLFKEVP